MKFNSRLLCVTVLAGVNPVGYAMNRLGMCQRGRGSVEVSKLAESAVVPPRPDSEAASRLAAAKARQAELRWQKEQQERSLGSRAAAELDRDSADAAELARIEKENQELEVEVSKGKGAGPGRRSPPPPGAGKGSSPAPAKLPVETALERLQKLGPPRAGPAPAGPGAVANAVAIAEC